MGRAAGGALVLSLDFELYWGVRDKRSLADYGENVLGARRAIPRMLEAFERHGLHATWATVGFLFHGSGESLRASLPDALPTYEDRAYSPYDAVTRVGSSEEADPYHLGLSLIERVAAVPGQEIATHTYSHLYCLERGVRREQIQADLARALEIGRARGFQIRSIVFPRNQYDDDTVRLCGELGLVAYRGNEASPVYTASNHEAYRRPDRRIIRLLDTFAPVTGSHVVPWPRPTAGPVNVPAARFLRPYSRATRALEGLKWRRIQAELERAAREGGLFHLWWHPHNFGRDAEENLAVLDRLGREVARLRERFGLESLNMGEVADRVREAA